MLRPIFISGCDCSGSQYLSELLGLSDWVINPPMSYFLQDFAVQTLLEVFADEMSASEWFLQQPSYVKWDLTLNKTQLGRIINVDHPRLTVENIIKQYHQTHCHDRPNADVWIDHTAGSFHYYSTLKALFPEALYIHIMRDGRSVAASIIDEPFGPNNAYTASRYWAHKVELGLNVERAEGKNCLRIRYEDLLDNPRRTLEEICKFIAIPFSEKMLADSSSKQIDPATSWAERFTGKQLRCFESYEFSHQLLSSLGYPIANNTVPRASLTCVLFNYMHDFFCGLRNRFQTKRGEERATQRYIESLHIGGNTQKPASNERNITLGGTL